MPYLVALLDDVNLFLSEAKRNPSRRDEIVDALRSSSGLPEAVERLQLLSQLDTQALEDASVLLGSVPASLEAALLGGLASAVERDLHVSVTWKPSYDFELTMWESTRAGVGGMTMLLASPTAGELRTRNV
jgi:hypothetical protein